MRNFLHPTPGGGGPARLRGAVLSLDLFFVTLLPFPARPAFAAPNSARPPNGPKGTVLVTTNLYVAADTTSTRLDEVAPGRELIVMERNGPWVRVFANTDEQASQAADAPVFGSQAASTPVSGWMQAGGVVSSETPQGDMILFGAAASEERAAAEPHSPHGAAQAARLLYKREADLFPQSPLTPEAIWRSADIRWQLQKADVFSLPSGHEKDAYLRETIDENEMHRIEKQFPNSRYADLAAWDLLDNKICGDWQGSTECPEKESAMYSRYAEDHPNSPKAAEALYDAEYRLAVLKDMYAGDGEEKRSALAAQRATDIAANLESKYPTSDYAARGEALIYKLQNSLPIYGIDRE